MRGFVALLALSVLLLLILSVGVPSLAAGLFAPSARLFIPVLTTTLGATAFVITGLHVVLPAPLRLSLRLFGSLFWLRGPIPLLEVLVLLLHRLEAPLSLICASVLVGVHPLGHLPVRHAEVLLRGSLGQAEVGVVSLLRERLELLAMQGVGLRRVDKAVAEFVDESPHLTVRQTVDPPLGIHLLRGQQGGHRVGSEDLPRAILIQDKGPS
mmetsp:Transcript_55193/g.124614  ORF Transcript_55193/g.124614 Transcript_55193/m.124614 type:complete len:211 (-) Transcript_55193:119-751(-)